MLIKMSFDFSEDIFYLINVDNPMGHDESCIKFKLSMLIKKILTIYF